MFSFIQSPCVFEPLPIVNMFAGEQSVISPEHKRRRATGRSHCPHSRYMPRESLAALRYTVEESPEGYVLSLLKKVPKGMIVDAVNQQLAELKEESYRPTYHLVHDMWGNPYYLEEKADENELLRDALARLDLKAIYRKIARGLFQEYEIDLNHRGDELTVSSSKDGVSKAFEIGECIEDVRVIGCKLDDNQEYGILKIGLVKSNRTNEQSTNIINLIQWPQSKPGEESTQVTAKEATAMCQANFEDELRAKLEAQAEAHKMEQKKREEEEAEARRVQQIKLKEENVKRVKAAKKEEERRKELEEQRRSAAEEKERELRQKKEQKLKEKKALLIEKQRAKRLEAESQKSNGSSPSSASSPKTVTININFGNDNGTNEVEQNVTDSNSSLKRYASPVLEDVDDAEFHRFDGSLSRSPSGSSIIEDV